MSNSKHTTGLSGGGAGNNKASIEPSNSLSLFENSKKIGGKRYAVDSNGNLHQLTDNKVDGWHWAGGSADKKVPLTINDNGTKSQLNKTFPNLNLK